MKTTQLSTKHFSYFFHACAPVTQPELFPTIYTLPSQWNSYYHVCYSHSVMKMVLLIFSFFLSLWSLIFHCYFFLLNFLLLFLDRVCMGGSCELNFKITIVFPSSNIQTLLPLFLQIISLVVKICCLN